MKISWTTPSSSPSPPPPRTTTALTVVSRKKEKKKKEKKKFSKTTASLPPCHPPTTTAATMTTTTAIVPAAAVEQSITSNTPSLPRKKKKKQSNNDYIRCYCNYCGKANATKLCKLCQVSTYCGQKCYASDWKKRLQDENGLCHQEICPILKKQSEEVSTELLRKILNELFEAELKHLKPDFDDLHSLSCFLLSGRVALVLARVAPCVVIGIDSLFHSILQPWLQKHKHYLQSWGFDCGFVRERLSSGINERKSFIFKDRRSPFIDTVDRTYPTWQRNATISSNFTFPREHYENIARSLGHWEGSIYGSNVEEAIRVSYCWHVKSAREQIPEEHSPPYVFKALAEPKNAEDVGTHFMKVREVAQQFFAGNLDLKLGLLHIERWPIDAILTMLTSMAKNDISLLLSWLETDQVLFRSDFKKFQWKLIMKKVRALHEEQQQRENYASLDEAWL